MIRYKVGYKRVATGVHAQVLDFPAAITCAADLDAARKLLVVALANVADAHRATGMPLPAPNPAAIDADMDLVEPIDLCVPTGSEAADEWERKLFEAAVASGVTVPDEALSSDGLYE